MVGGVLSLTTRRSETPSKFEQWLEKRFGSEGLMKWIIGIAVAAGIAFAIALFIILPTLFTSGLLYFFPDAPMWLRNLLEGVVKLVIFFCYLYFCSRLKDIHRTFQYHGAEHKTIFCYERGLELTVENARKMPRHHPRCGTSFLFVVIVVAVLASCVVFALPGIRDVAANPLVRILLPPGVAAHCGGHHLVRSTASFGRHDNPVTRVLSAPGMVDAELYRLRAGRLHAGGGHPRLENRAPRKRREPTPGKPQADPVRNPMHWGERGGNHLP